MTVEDNVAPECLTQDITVQTDDNGNATATAAQTDNGSNDACGIQSVSLAPTAFDCNDVGDNTVTLTVTDNNGNVNTCTATVTVEDNVLPECLTQNITAQLDDNGNATVAAAQVDNGSNDACGIQSLTLAPSAFDCANVGDNIVTLTVTDNNGNVNTCTAIVTAEDNIAPLCQTQDVEVFLDENGEAGIEIDDIDSNSTDACGIAIYALDVTDFTCDNFGSNTVTLTLTDVNDNVSSCTAEVTVTDAIPPQVTCRQPISTCNEPGLCGAHINLLPPFVDDNCGVASITDNAPADDFFPIGTTPLTWTVTDDFGNQSTCVQEVTVTDEEAPEIVSCSTEIAFGTDNCSAYVLVSVDPTDNCGIESITNTGIFTYEIGGIYHHEVLITDVNGLQTTHTIVVYVHDENPPAATFCPEDMTVETPTEMTSLVLPEPIFVDDCELASVENDAPTAFPLGTTTVVWTATDGYGLQGSCAYDVTMTAPNLTIGRLPERIEACVEAADEAALVLWNAPDTETECDYCPTTEYEDFQYLGDFYGHQYFLYVGEDSMSFSDAQTAAEADLNAHLASVDDERENLFVSHILPADAENIRIGLQIAQTSAGFIYTETNGDAAQFTDALNTENWTEENSFVVMDAEGNRTLTNGREAYGFLVERPCVELVQTGPTVTLTNADEETEEVILRSGDAWAVGEYTVTYEAENMCGDVIIREFPVSVATPQAEYCQSAGTDTDVFIENSIFSGVVYAENNADGYTDFTENITEISELLPTNETGELIEPTHLIWTLQPGGAAADESLYWNVWFDRNHDGDFFDANELMVHTRNTGILTAELPLSLFGADAVQSRVSVSRFGYPEVCADYYSGETEDYSFAYNPLLQHSVFGERSDGKTPTAAQTTEIVPNPAENYATVHTPLFAQDGKLTLRNVQGETVLQLVLAAEQNRHTLSLQDLPAGLYLTEIKSGEFFSVLKLVVK